MVASVTSIRDRFTSPPAGLLAGQYRLVRFTWRDALALVRMGIIPEDASTELLNGMVVLTDRSARDQDPTMIGQEHRRCVEALSSLRKLIDTDQRHVESQQPLICSEIHVPEPDFVVLRGTLKDYRELPTAGDAWCVIEVADSSYERDRGEKYQGYARAGIEQYIIINLRNRTAEVYASPNSTAGTYPEPLIISSDQELQLRVGAAEQFAVNLVDLLP
jgi:Uma2 family endonuclease